MRMSDPDDKYYSNIQKFYKRFLDDNVPIYVSTIAVSEFCTKGNLNELVKGLRYLTFSITHAQRSGEFNRVLLAANKEDEDKEKRYIVINDAKMLAQADIEKHIEYFVTTDSNLRKKYDRINAQFTISCALLNVADTPYEKFYKIADGQDSLFE